ncbi:hypothetical protein Taro_015008 [Colocasia esculenta]|uniref:Uncharacterized protein n=1 Tax=Colocasia esculenta TaxID=4460 RepID=A0A843UNN4_COLES|nr:hypothetical protein [Colocasia esculenta]
MRTRAFPRTPINQQKQWKQTKAKVEGKGGKEKKKFCSRVALFLQVRQIDVHTPCRLLEPPMG